MYQPHCLCHRRGLPGLWAFLEPRGRAVKRGGRVPRVLAVGGATRARLETSASLGILGRKVCPGRRVSKDRWVSRALVARLVNPDWPGLTARTAAMVTGVGPGFQGREAPGVILASLALVAVRAIADRKARRGRVGTRAERA